MSLNVRIRIRIKYIGEVYPRYCPIETYVLRIFTFDLLAESRIATGTVLGV